jgi:hypothetical protein
MVRNAEIGILHSLYNQAPKKAILYEKQYICPAPIIFRLQSSELLIGIGNGSHFAEL